MMPDYWQDAKGIVLVYDVTRIHTLEACGIWYQRVLEATGAQGLPGVIVANKIDLRERLVVNRKQGQQMAESLGMGEPGNQSFCMIAGENATSVPATA